MNVLWLSWKDLGHPQAGGAELVSGEIMSRLVHDGHTVQLITSRYADSSPQETVDGIHIHRVGGRFSVYLKAYFLFLKQFKTWPDIVIDEMNTIPFAAGLYSSRRNILLTYQLARKVWFYQMPFPVSIIGYLIEPLYLRVIARRYNTVITESQSTVEDLARHGFDKTKIRTIRVGITPLPLVKLTPKKSTDTILILGSIRPMKQTLDGVKAFEIARDSNSKLHLIIAGNDSGGYAQSVRNYIKGSRHAGAIEVLGSVSNKLRLELMREAGLILATSVKEGWGLTVTEANSQGTPAIAYDTDGLRDSVQNNQTGLLIKSGDIHAMGIAITYLLSDSAKYNNFRIKGWELSKQYTFDNSYRDFINGVGIES
jgi:glycosyltransferase involved in cell wall biosynthesis